MAFDGSFLDAQALVSAQCLILSPTSFVRSVDPFSHVHLCSIVPPIRPELVLSPLLCQGRPIPVQVRSPRQVQGQRPPEAEHPRSGAELLPGYRPLSHFSPVPGGPPVHVFPQQRRNDSFARCRAFADVVQSQLIRRRFGVLIVGTCVAGPVAGESRACCPPFGATLVVRQSRPPVASLDAPGRVQLGASSFRPTSSLRNRGLDRGPFGFYDAIPSAP